MLGATKGWYEESEDELTCRDCAFFLGAKDRYGRCEYLSKDGVAEVLVNPECLYCEGDYFTEVDR